MKRLLPTLLALAALAALGTYIGLYESKPRTGEEERKKIYEVKQEDVTKFSLQDLEKGTDLTCEKEAGGAWWMTVPIRLETEADTVDLVTRHLANPEVERDLGPQSDLTPFGLHKPVFKAELFTRNGKSHILFIGARNPTGSAYFAREESGKSVYTAASYSVDNIRKSLSELRSKTLISFDPGQVTRLVLKRGKTGAVELVRQGPESWRLAAPVAAPADRYAVDGLLNDLKGLKGTDVIEEPQAYSRYRLDQPAAEVIVYTGTSTAQQLYLSRPDRKKEETYASSTRLPFVFKLSSAYVLNNVTKGIDEFRERVLVSVNREDLTELRLTQGNLSIVCGKGADGKWSVKTPAGSKADDEMNDVLFEVIYVRAEKFADDKPKTLSVYGLAPARIEVAISGVKDKQPFSYRYLLGNRAGDRAYLKLPDQPGVVEVRKELLEKVQRFADRVRAGPVAPGPAPAKAASSTLSKP